MKKMKPMSKRDSTMRHCLEKISDLTTWKSIDQSTVEQFERAVNAEKATRKSKGRFAHAIKRFV